MSKVLFAVLAVAVVAASPPLPQPGARPVVLTLKNHRFSPDTVTVTAGTPIDVTLINQDAAIEEFDSDDLDLEETAHPGETIHFRIPAQIPGQYDFMGEFHSSTARGRLIVMP